MKQRDILEFKISAQHVGACLHRRKNRFSCFAKAVTTITENWSFENFEEENSVKIGPKLHKTIKNGKGADRSPTKTMTHAQKGDHNKAFSGVFSWENTTLSA